MRAAFRGKLDRGQQPEGCAAGSGSADTFPRLYFTHDI
jgi:hypothetical protein